jgi:lysozyme
MPAVVLIIGLLGLGALAIFGAMQAGVLPNMNSATADFANNTGDGGDPIALALPLIQGFETFSAAAYPDPPGSGKYSIGWGHSIRPGDPYNATSVISQAEGDDLLRVDVGAAWTCVFQNVQVPCSSQSFAALISFVYNEGCTAFKSSTLLADLNAGDFEAATADFAEWNKEHVNGVLRVSENLTARRAQEAALFASGVNA